MPWEAFGRSHIGNRDRNEDSWIFLIDENSNECLAMVADGMGGHKNGAEASGIVRSTAANIWSSRCDVTSVEDLLKKLVSASHDAIQTFNVTHSSDSQSTIAALWIQHQQAFSIHVGDTRVHQFDSKGLIKQTSDHTVAAYQQSIGKLTEQESPDHPGGSVLLTSLGGREPPDPELISWQLNRDAGFVLCTDGFWNWITPHDQLAVLKTTNPGAALAVMMQDSLRKHPGDRDNMTAILLRRKLT